MECYLSVREWNVLVPVKHGMTTEAKLSVKNGLRFDEVCTGPYDCADV